ncbi:MAG: transglycosylase domain-containing protein [Candidatus Egerieousia sp.]|nr:transglycosylase domain-containing protein [Candidatus Egerieousia sp.]
MVIKNKKRVAKLLWFIIFSPLAIILAGLLAVGLFADIPSFEELEDPKSNLATQIISDNGTPINSFHIENRSYITFDQIPQGVRDALVATEDVRFYKHSGIDLKSLARVAIKSFLMGNRNTGGGGSTLTQQLAKTLFPRDTVKSRIPGAKFAVLAGNKLKEWITAVKIERNYAKDEILTMYLNTVFFGSNAYGIETAANTFFGKNTKDLKIEEGALLVGMVNLPTRYNPVRNPELSLKRRNHVLKQMNKYGYLEDAIYDSIVKLPITLNFTRMDHNAGLAPHFRDMLKRVMSASKPSPANYYNRHDYTADSLLWEEDPLYGWLNKNLKPDGTKYNLDKDGLKIYTPINAKMQQYAEEAVAEHLGNTLQPAFNRELKWKPKRPFSSETTQEVIDHIMKQARRWSDRYRMMKREGISEQKILKSFKVPAKMRVFAWNKQGYIDTTMTPDDSIKYYKSFLRAGLMALEPGTGNIKAYVGGGNYRYFKYDQVRQGKRQVGSTFKPFLYALAMQEGFTPCDKVVNVPQSFVVGEDIWTPKSTDKPEWIGKTVTLKWGLTKSSNNISAYLMKQLGPTALVNMAHSMGLSCWLDPVPSLCVGSADVPVYEMVSAFNTFPGRGIYATPLAVLRIEDKNGNVLSTFTSKKREAISERTAYLMVNLMEGVVNGGTAYRLRSLYIPEGAIAGKTGTTNDQSDGWFIGYTPKLTAGVWVGAEDRQVHFASLALGGGSNMALPIWGLFMQKVFKDGTLGVTKFDTFTTPADFNIDLNCTGGDEDINYTGSSEEREAEEFFD